MLSCADRQPCTWSGPINLVALKNHSSWSGLQAAASLVAVEKNEPWAARLAKASLVLALLIGATLLVYASGGTRFSYVHVTYIAIIAGAACFGFPGGLGAAVLAGLAMGPFMPLDVEAGTAQSTTNWLIRAGLFVLIGGAAGLGFHLRDRQVQQIRKQSFYDGITGLPNRSLCIQKLEELIQSGKGETESVLVLSFSLGQFEAIRSSFGHEHADALQLACAERIKDMLPDEAKLFHIRSGVFALVLVAAPEQAVRLGATLLEALDEAFLVNGIPMLSGGHVGLAELGVDAEDALSLIRASLAAVQSAEAANQPISVFNKKRDSDRRSALKLMPDLQRALRSFGEITLHYQPKVDLMTGVCTGAEALVRWHHPERGWLPPASFIPLAEQTTLIKPLTLRVLDMGLAQLASWQKEGLELSLAVNLSIRNLEDEDLPFSITELLGRHSIDPSRLQVEVTESCLIESLDVVTANLNALRALRVSVALDDFGTGQSSLSYLRDLPADSLKLDRSFLRDLATDTKSRVIVGAAIETAHQLGFAVVAEGIETREDYEQLRALSCDFGQGYLIAKPLAAADFRSWVAAHSQALTQIRSIA
jgi:EAL domain-containing protein (putative c-di-GMP-specific phosphodiesterase class I)/GGDEF domain-containing protein